MSELYQGFIEVNSSYKYKFTLIDIIHDILIKDWNLFHYVFYNRIVLKDYGEYFLFHLYGKDLNRWIGDCLDEDKCDYVPEYWEVETMIPLDYSLNEALLAIKLCLENERSNIRTRIRVIKEERRIGGPRDWELNLIYGYDLLHPHDILNDLRCRKKEFENVCKYITKKMKINKTENS